MRQAQWNGPLRNDATRLLYRDRDHDHDLLSPSADSRAGIHQEEGAESTESLPQVFRAPDSLDSRDDSRRNT